MSSDEPRFEALLDYLKGTRGFDFTAYKRSSLMRRIQKRQQAASIESYDAYQAYLEAHPEEFGLLFNTILINVTSFFRDQEAWTSGCRSSSSGSRSARCSPARRSGPS
jgi:two-component system, chemotaxis family, CheB/CheR fusion protein